MARRTAKRKPRRKAAGPGLGERLDRWTRLVVRRIAIALAALAVFGVLFFWVFNPTVTPYMLSERARLGEIKRGWVEIEEVATVMRRSAVAAEDANFCNHWGFDMVAIRAALEEGAGRGASTISQQVVKNVYLWHGRSWLRKALEAVLTPMVELVWSKKRILEVYLNVVEFDEGVFGIRAAAEHHFGVSPDKLSPEQAAVLAAVLPAPKARSAVAPSQALARRAVIIADGAETIRKDGRADCFATP